MTDQTPFTMPTAEQLATLDTATFTKFWEIALHEQQRREDHAVLMTLRTELAALGPIDGLDGPPVRVVFETTEYENGWFFDDTGQVYDASGSSAYVDFASSDFRAALANVSASADIGEHGGLTVDLTAGTVDAETYLDEG